MAATVRCHDEKRAGNSESDQRNKRILKTKAVVVWARLHVQKSKNLSVGCCELFECLGGIDAERTNFAWRADLPLCLRRNAFQKQRGEPPTNAERSTVGTGGGTGNHGLDVFEIGCIGQGHMFDAFGDAPGFASVGAPEQLLAGVASQGAKAFPESRKVGNRLLEGTFRLYFHGSLTVCRSATRARRSVPAEDERGAG